MSDEAPLVRSPLLLLVVTVLAVGLFIIVLAVAAFLLRNAPTSTRPPGHMEIAEPTTREPRAGEPSVKTDPPIGPRERQSASTALAPVFPACYREARARDPSLGREVDVTLGLDTRPTGGTITSLHVGRGGSPYLAACLRERLVGAGFPAGAHGRGEVTWRVTHDGDEAKLSERPR